MLKHLILTKWGYCINIEELKLHKDVAWLSYDGKHSDIKEKEYKVKLFYSCYYAKNPESNCKNWTKVTGDSIEEIKERVDFDKYNLTNTDISIYFEIRK